MDFSKFSSVQLTQLKWRKVEGRPGSNTYVFWTQTHFSAPLILPGAIEPIMRVLH